MNRVIALGLLAAIGAAVAMVTVTCTEEAESNYVFVTSWGGDAQFRGPLNVAVDTQGNVYVADRSNDRIQVFAPQPSP